MNDDHVLAVVAPTIDTATGLQLQPATAYTTLPAQYSIYTPTAIYSHLPATTLIPGTLASPGKEGKSTQIDDDHHPFDILFKLCHNSLDLMVVIYSSIIYLKNSVIPN